jgi:uncharacterized protein (UPF0276 family)
VPVAAPCPSLPQTVAPAVDFCIPRPYAGGVRGALGQAVQDRHLGRQSREDDLVRADDRVPELGLGIGWRRELADFIAAREDLGFVEVLAESLPRDGALPEGLAALRRRAMPVIPHGVSLSLGGAEPPGEVELSHLARVAERLDAPFASEHVCFVRADGIDSGHLLPLPRTRDALDVLCENVERVTSVLPVPLALENVASLFEWPGAEMDEASFLSQLLERTGCLLLLDISNLYANARNHGIDPLAYLDQLPLERLAYVHVAGGIEQRGLYHDTHAHAVPGGALELLAQLRARVRPKGVMLERDERYPPPAEIDAELDAILAALSPESRSRRETA